MYTYIHKSRYSSTCSKSALYFCMSTKVFKWFTGCLDISKQLLKAMEDPTISRAVPAERFPH